ncbi:MAG: hypothetical protein KAS32_25825, partial [Candidatus Peribacteraceae bacterium]|nr:hypothetical protein [Candidatus Peribacteraceae bacterium]
GYGQQKWIGGTFNDTCYFDKNTTVSYPFTVKGQLKNNIEQPDWSSGQPFFNVTDQIFFRFNETSDCSSEGLIPDTETAIMLHAPNGSNYTCSPIENETVNGWYNCTWDSSDQNEGNWTVNISSAKQYFVENETVLTNWFWLENLNATSANITVQPQRDGWSVLYNYTVLINDSDSDHINCSLFINKSDGSGWIYKGSDNLYSPTGVVDTNCSVEVWDFTGEDIGNNSFYFLIQNGEAANDHNTSVVYGPYLEKPNITIVHIQGNDTYVNISDSNDNNTMQLILRVDDTDNSSSPSGVNTTTWVMYNASIWNGGNFSQTNSSGYINYMFNPNCSYTPGANNWTAGTIDSYYQEINHTGNLVIHILGDLNNTIISPVNVSQTSSQFLRGTNITIRVKLTDLCGNNITGYDSSITLNMTSTYTGQVSNCGDIFEEGDGVYNCTFNTSGMPARFYNVNMFSNISHYNTHNLTSYNAFFIDTEPVLTAWNMSPSDDWGWGEEYTFTVNATDEDGDVMEVCLYINKSNSWGQAGCNITVSGVNTTVTFVKASDAYFHAGDRGPGQYKLNVSDNLNSPYVTGPQYTDETDIEEFTLIGDDVEINVTMGNASVINRTNPDYQWQVKIYDIDLEPDKEVSAGTEGKFYYTKNMTEGTFYESLTKNTLGSAGIINFRDEDPESDFTDCEFVIGPQLWMAGVTADNPAYKSINSSYFDWTMVTQNISAIILDPDGISRVRGQDNVTFRANVTDDCGAMSSVTVNFHVLQQGSPTVYETCAPTEYEGSGIYNCTMVAGIHAAWDTGWYNSTLDANKQYYNGTTDQMNNSFFIATSPSITSTYAQSDEGSSTGGWGENWLFVLTDLVDNDGDTMNVTLWHNITGTWENANSTTTIATSSVRFEGHTFQCSDLLGQPESQKQYNFTVVDYWNYTDEDISVFTLERDDTQSHLIFVAPNTQSFYREGTNTRLLKAFINDTDIGDFAVQVGSNGSFQMMTNKSDSQFPDDYLTINRTTTVAGGNISYVFDPNCTFGVGDMSWYVGTQNDTCYDDDSSYMGFVRIVGSLKNNIQQPNWTSGQPKFQVGVNVSIRFNVTTDCSNEDRQQGLTDISIRLRSPTGGWEHCNSTQYVIDEGTGWYNCTWDTFLHQGGNWSVELNTSKWNASSGDYFVSNSTVLVDHFYLNNTPPDYGNFSVTPTEDGWGAVYNYSVDIWDSQTDNVTCKLFVKTNNYGGAWVLKNSTIIVGGQDTCTLFVTDFECADIGNDTVNQYRFELDDDTTNFNTTDQNGPNITADSVAITYYHGNMSTVNRSNAEPDYSALFIVNVTDTDNNQSANTNVSFWVTTNSSNPDSWVLANMSTTNSTGYANITFDPGCDPQYGIGNQTWVAGTTDSCYAYVNTTETMNITIRGTLATTIYTISPSPEPEEEILRGKNVTQQVYVESDCGGDYVNDADTGIYFENNVSGTEYYCDSVYRIGANGFYECERNSTDMEARWYNTRANSSRNDYNMNETVLLGHFFITTYPQVFNASLNLTTAGWGENRNFTVTVNDDD